jgi:hypothetical protein
MKNVISLKVRILGSNPFLTREYRCVLRTLFSSELPFFTKIKQVIVVGNCLTEHLTFHELFIIHFRWLNLGLAFIFIISNDASVII